MPSPVKLLSACLVAFAVARAGAESPPVRSAAELLRLMTLEEKLGQLTQLPGGMDPTANPGDKARRLEELLGPIRKGAVGSFLGAHGAEYTNTLQRAAVEESRLKIPLILGNDVIHGYRTIFPIPLGEAATWNPELIEQASHVAAIEARAAGTHWTFAPMIDVCRDPRWGRIAETHGEDHFLGAAFAAARVRGFQGADPSAPDRVLACGKHFVAYGGAEGGRDYNTVDIGLPTLHEVHLRTFKAAVDAGVGSLMSSFNEISGIPASGNPYTLRTVLRNQWKFEGFVVSDWTSVTELVAHGFARDDAEAALIAIRAGVDMDMSSSSYVKHLGKAVAGGALPEAIVDEAVLRVLQAKERVGLFRNPYTDSARETEVMLTDAHRVLARRVAQQSLVLLKNENNVLPLSRDIHSLAVIGPLAEADRDALGTWAAVGRAKDVVTVLAGLREVFGERVRYEKGGDVRAAIEGGAAKARDVAAGADAVLLVLGESENMSGEGHSRASIELPDAQVALAREVHAAGRPLIVVLLNGRPLAIPWLAENADAIVVAWHPGVECGHAVADVLTGAVNPSGKLPATFPRSTGQIPLYYNHKNTGRPPRKENRYTSKYIDVDWTPQYVFGHGLSYTQFAYDELSAEPKTPARDGTVSVSVRVTNAGDRAGDEVVQVYYRDPVAGQTRPVRQLCGFRRVSLEAGASEIVRIEVPVAEFGYYDLQGRPVIEPGEIELYVGGSSAATLATTIELR
jgi:beta-glucosidase